MNLDAPHNLSLFRTRRQGEADSGSLSPKETSCLLLAPLTGTTLFPGPGLSLDNQLEGGLFSRRLGGHEDCVSC